MTSLALNTNQIPLNTNQVAISGFVLQTGGPVIPPGPVVGTPGKINLVTQTGMPPIYQSRSRELIYDALENSSRFIKNPFGPQFLILARAQFRW